MNRVVVCAVLADAHAHKSQGKDQMRLKTDGIDIFEIEPVRKPMRFEVYQLILGTYSLKVTNS